LNQIDFLVEGRHRVLLALSTQLCLGLLGSFLIGISLPFETLKFFAQVSIVIGPACGFLFPPLSTLLDFIG
jgi:hypothetical protein